jgi:hypothetical protein
MQIYKIGFPAIVTDNELAYFQMLQAVIESVDELAQLRAVRKLNAVAFVLTPSAALYTQNLLQGILSYHTLLGIQLTLSKSIRTTSTIQFEIALDNA